jgi:hypothetical protein
VTLLGTNFQSGATVAFGAAAAGSVHVASASTVTAAAPSAAAAGTVAVTVTNPDTQSATLAGAFTYDAGARFWSVPPCRVVDTRDSAGPWGGPALASSADRIFVVAGRCGIPSTARAVATNVTVTQPAGSGFVTLYGGGTSRPLVSNVNFGAGQTRASDAVLPLGALGNAAVYCFEAGGGTAHLVLYVSGYFE